MLKWKAAVQLHAHTHYIYIYIYIYIYERERVLFGPVKTEWWVILSGQEKHSKTEHINFPGRERNVINITEQYFLLEKKQRALYFGV